jgi:hypothetical protein
VPAFQTIGSAECTTSVQSNKSIAHDILVSTLLTRKDDDACLTVDGRSNDCASLGLSRIFATCTVTLTAVESQVAHIPHPSRMFLLYFGAGSRLLREGQSDCALSLLLLKLD